MMVKQSLDLFGGSLLVILGVGLLIYTCSIGEQFWLTTLAATLLVTGLYAANGVGHLVFGNRVTVFLGEISYSLYMTHIMARSSVMCRSIAQAPYAVAATDVASPISCGIDH